MSDVSDDEKQLGSRRAAERIELCGNGLDDDGNGAADDGCSCDSGAVRSCYFGLVGTENIGTCRSGMQACATGEFATWGPCLEAVLPTREIDASEFDEDCDGVVDEGGVCVAQAETSSAACSDQRDNDCDGRADCDDPECAAIEDLCAPTSATETVCNDGIDDDRDGKLDCGDPECMQTEFCAFPPRCPAGSEVYRERDLGREFGESNIRRGDGQPIQLMTCETTPPKACAAGEVAFVPRPTGGSPTHPGTGEGLDVPGLPSQMAQPGTPQCVPAPPSCSAGESPMWRDTSWHCSAPCELIVHYGGIYAFETVCAPNVPETLSCPGGQVPTFVYETEQWECAPTCNDDEYDRHYVDEMLVCIPC